MAKPGQIQGDLNSLLLQIRNQQSRPSTKEVDN